jgi:hypothetical protein
MGKTRKQHTKTEKDNWKIWNRPEKLETLREKHKIYTLARAITFLGEPTMRPEPAPTLKGKCAKEFAKRMEQSPSAETIRIFKEAEQVSKKIEQVR